MSYHRVPNNDVGHEDELEAAFDGPEDADDADETSRLTHSRSSLSQAIPGAYDFERDYDQPPPGSPTHPPPFAVPNAFGNTNGLVPTSEPVRPAGPSWLGRAFRGVFGGPRPPARAVGSGLDNDGVFANVVAKPNGQETVMTRIEDETGVHWVPEVASKDVPPSYAAAAADQPPSYWPETILAPRVPSVAGELVVDGLPTGTLFSFAWAFVISWSFQFVGFVLTYILHTNHAGKFGSRAGLAVNLIQSGYFMHRQRERLMNSEDEFGPTRRWRSANAVVVTLANGTDPSSGSMMAADDMQVMPMFSDVVADWLSFFLMTAGWFLLLISILGFWRVKRFEMGILRGQASSIPADSSIRNRSQHPLAGSFLTMEMLRTGLGLYRSRQSMDEESSLPNIPPPEEQVEVVIEDGRTRETQDLEERLAANFRAAGIL